MSEESNNKKNNRKDFFNNFIESFEEFFQSGDFPTFPEMDWLNKPEAQEKLKELGRMFWGFSSFIGPDGVPQTKMWGNINPPGGLNLVGGGKTANIESGLENNHIREPFIDIIEEEDKIRILAELPGIKKEDIDLKAKRDGLKLSARNFAKFIPLDVEIDPKSIKATYNNGVLEIRIDIANKENNDSGFKVKVN